MLLLATLRQTFTSLFPVLNTTPPTYYLFLNTRQKSKNESQESATESEEIQPAKNRSFRRSKVSKNQDSDDNTISSNEKKIVRKSPPQIIVHKSQPSEHKQGTLYH